MLEGDENGNDTKQIPILPQLSSETSRGANRNNSRRNYQMKASSMYTYREKENIIVYIDIYIYISHVRMYIYIYIYRDRNRII